jgi:hypothetical protein
MVFSETAAPATEEGGRKSRLLEGFLRCRHGLPDAFFFCRVIIKFFNVGVVTDYVSFLLPHSAESLSRMLFFTV